MQRRKKQSNVGSRRLWQLREGHDVAASVTVKRIEKCCLSTTKTKMSTDRTRLVLPRLDGYSTIPTSATNNKYEHARVVRNGTRTNNIEMSVIKLFVRFFDPNTRTVPTDR